MKLPKSVKKETIAIIGVVLLLFLIAISEINFSLHSYPLSKNFSEQINPKIIGNTEIYLTEREITNFYPSRFGKSASGKYNPYFDRIGINIDELSKGNDFYIDLCHELMHSYWFTTMSSQEKKQWNMLYKSTQKYLIEKEGKEWVKNQYFLLNRFEFHATLNEENFDKCYNFTTD